MFKLIVLLANRGDKLICKYLSVRNLVIQILEMTSNRRYYRLEKKIKAEGTHLQQMTSHGS